MKIIAKIIISLNFCRRPANQLKIILGGIYLAKMDPSFRPAPITSFHSVFSWPSFGQLIFWVSNITLFCPAFQKVFVYYHLPWPVAPPSKISIYFEFLTLPSFVQHSKKFLFTIDAGSSLNVKKCLFNVLITGQSNFDERNGQLPRVSFAMK